MAIITLTADTNYTAIAGLVNGDTIRCATFRLTVNSQPTHIDIIVDSPGTAGRMTVTGALDLSTWSIIAGNSVLIDGTFPAGATLGASTGGAAGGAIGIQTNNGTVTTATGGSVQHSGNGVQINNGTVTNAVGGTGNSCVGVAHNNGTVTNATGGSTSFNANGVGANNGTVINATGGISSGTYGVNLNSGTVITANGGSYGSATGINVNQGTCLRAFDNAARAINVSRGDFKIVNGPDFRTTIDQTNDTITTIYSLGALSNLAVIPVGVTVIVLSASAGGGLILPRSMHGGYSA